MKEFRKIIFWCHLTAGAFAGVVVLIMSVTGVLLAYEKQMLAWADARTYSIAPPSPATRLPIATLVARARESKPAAAAPTNITFRHAAAAAAVVGFGREGSVFINPYTGEVLGEGAKGARDFFRAVTDWHRWLGAGGENRGLARGVTGACNLAFLFLVSSGLYLWLPRLWTRKQVRSVAWFKRGLSGRARDFNWHNVIGLWSVAPLFVVVLAAVPLSYTWAGDLVYRIVGETPPPPRAAQAPPPVNPVQQRGGGERGTTPLPLDGLDQLLARAEQQTPEWRSISLPLPAAPDAPVTFTIDTGTGGQPHKRAQLTLGRAGGEVVRYESFASYSRGRQIRSFLRFAHTGEVAGLAGQSVAGLASLGGAFLVWTGLSLAWRRFRAWQARRRVPRVELAVEETGGRAGT